MHPEICRIGPFTIYSYGLMLVVAFFLSSFLALASAKRQGLNPEIIFNLCFLVLIWGVIGARLLYIFQNMRYYLERPLEIIMLQHGGLSWFGGLGLAIVCAIIYIKKKKLSVYKILDLIAPFAALAQAVGRIGCFLNGCCYGKESAWGIYFVAHKATLIPVQLYSSFLLVVIFIILRFMQNRPHKKGQILFAYLLFYSIKRFFIEFWRMDSLIIFHGLTLFQIFCIPIFFLSLVKLILLKKDKG